MLLRYLRVLSITVVFLIVGAMIIVSAGYYYLMHTTPGAKWAFNYLASNYLGAKQVKYREFEGTLADGIKVSNIRIEDLDKFTTRSLILIQHLDVMVPGLDTRKTFIKIRNGRIKFPLSDPLGFYGTIEGGQLKLNLYCGIIDVREIVSVIKSDLALHNMEGTATKAQMTISGNYKKPQISGDFLLEEFRYMGFSLTMLPASFQYTLDPSGPELLWMGELSVPSGQVLLNKAKIDLTPSRLVFDGAFRNPLLDIHGSTKINQIQISLSFAGTKKKPILNVMSNPPKPKNVLLVLIATGQELMTVDGPSGTEDLSFRSDNDFVDYFTFSSEERSGQAFGITDFSMDMNDNEKWLGIKKRLNDRLKVGINLQETKTIVNGQNVDVTRSVGGEVQVADHITLGVDKKVSGAQDPAQKLSSEPAKDSGMDVRIKYKKNF